VAKAALVSHSKALAISLAPMKIRVNVVALGSIEFPGGRWEKVKHTNRARYDAILSSIPWGRLGTPEEVAHAVVFLGSARASWITGACLSIDGGQHRGNA
jgi:3-oxoacyl-[acyl-carrier protein] reductase